MLDSTINRSLRRTDPTKFPRDPVATPPADGDHSDRLVRRREHDSMGHEIITTLLEVEVTGDEDCGETIKCEVDYYRSVRGCPSSWDDPGYPDEYEIAAVRPFEDVRESMDDPPGKTTRRYLICPNWLAEKLMRCVDVSTLKGGGW